MEADRGESVGLLEPLLIGETSRHRGALGDLAIDLAAKSAGLRRSLPPRIAAALADLVRAMNCYYSNLIEGHDTHPIDIARALDNDYSADPTKRNLQLEARAHIAVQEWIDAGSLDARALSATGVREVHERFCTLLPEDLLWVTDPRTGECVRVIMPLATSAAVARLIVLRGCSVISQMSRGFRPSRKARQISTVHSGRMMPWVFSICRSSGSR